MKILICPDTFKGTFTAFQAAKIMAVAILETFPKLESLLCPMADGGAGTLDALSMTIPHTWQRLEVKNPLGKPIQARYLLLENEAVIEMAQAGGLLLVPPEERNPLYATTYGVGQLIAHALDQDISRIVVTLGGSATNDGGMGMAQALGVRFLDATFKDLEIRREEGYGGICLSRVEKIDLSTIHSKARQTEFVAATDVLNPLCGKEGASAIYGPQKGATPEMVEELDQGLAHFARIIERDLKFSVATIPGTGAAGGLGAGLVAFLGASIESGSQWIAEQIQLEEKISHADGILTGEGRIDGQTRYGKTVWKILEIARKYNKPVLAVGGCLGEGALSLEEEGMVKVVDASEGISFSHSELQVKAAGLLKKAVQKTFPDFVQRMEKL